MSRHRFVRNMALEGHLDDESLSDGGEDDMTPEQHLQLATAASKVRDILGPEDESGFTDEQISDTVWNQYFDVEASVDHLLKDKARKEAARERKAAQEREKAAKAAAAQLQPKTPQKKKGGTSTPGNATPRAPGTATPRAAGTATPRGAPAQRTQQDLDISGLRLNEDEPGEPVLEEKDLPPAALAREKLLEEVKKSFASEGGNTALSIVVVGHVDAGKSTLMGRLLYELGKIDERKRVQNERASAKVGKSSFSWAWEMDGTAEERERGVTMDIAQQTLITPKRRITVLDAPGHKDFIPNMISGATQADAALLVVDSSVGEFESGFVRGGQTREHMLLVRSLGVSQVIVAVNKLDTVEWSVDRYEEICAELKQFLGQAGFASSRTRFVPVCAYGGVNLASREGEESRLLNAWYSGPSLVDCLDKLEPPQRNIDGPLRIPLSNVFKGQTNLSHGVGVSGRIVSGVVQVGERLRVVPGDETAVVRLIEHEEDSVPWAAAGANVTLYLAAIDPIHLSIGSVLCLTHEPVKLSSSFEAKIMVFDVQKPIIVGASIELFCHAREASATITKLVSTLDRSTGAVIKQNPRLNAQIGPFVTLTHSQSSAKEHRGRRPSNAPVCDAVRVGGCIIVPARRACGRKQGHEPHPNQERGRHHRSGHGHKDPLSDNPPVVQSLYRDMSRQYRMYNQ